MNCTVCGKLHSKEQPLTVASNGEMLCPECLENLDTAEKMKARGYVESEGCPGLFFPEKDYAKMYPTSRAGKVDDAPAIRSRFATTGTLKVGNVELPVKDLRCDER